MPEEICPGKVHVYIADLDSYGGDNLLSADEQARAERLRSEKQRKRFISARSILRTLLSRYLGKRPEELAFSTGPNGKPEIAGVRFSISHSRNSAVYAFASDRCVGADIEWIGGADHQQIMKHLSERERRRIMVEPQEGREEAFYRCWTRKEAFVKANGGRLIDELGRDNDERGWRIADFVTRGCAVAVVAEGEDATILLRG